MAFALAMISLAIFAPAIRCWLVRWDPEQVLKRRYAQGDVDRESYEQALTDLQRYGTANRVNAAHRKESRTRSQERCWS